MYAMESTYLGGLDEVSSSNRSGGSSSNRKGCWVAAIEKDEPASACEDMIY